MYFGVNFYCLLLNCRHQSSILQLKRCILRMPCNDIRKFKPSAFSYRRSKKIWLLKPVKSMQGLMVRSRTRVSYVYFCTPYVLLCVHLCARQRRSCFTRVQLFCSKCAPTPFFSCWLTQVCGVCVGLYDRKKNARFEEKQNMYASLD